MATFPSINPSYNARKITTPQIRTTQFNAGYQNRIGFGLNTIPYQWTLTFDVSESDSDTIEGFLEARALDRESFDWQPPASAVAYKWICLRWTKRIPYVNRASLNMTFEQVFEP